MKSHAWCARFLFVTLAGVCALALSGCEDGENPAPAPADAIFITHDFGETDPDLYVAFGDSITWGSQPDAAPSYAERLSLLLDRNVVNEGIRGEQSGDGLARVDAVLAKHKPGFMLIVFGANDVFHDTPRRHTVTNLLQVVQRAKNNGTIPVLGTTLPILVEGHDEWTRAVASLNQQIRDLAARENILLVDLEALFYTDPDLLLRPDRVHPSSAGNAAIAQEFYELLHRIVVEDTRVRLATRLPLDRVERGGRAGSPSTKQGCLPDIKLEGEAALSRHGTILSINRNYPCSE